MQIKIGIWFHRGEITYFEINRLLMLTLSRLYAKEFFFDESSSIKKATIYQNLHNSNGNTYSFIPRVCFFISPLDCWFRRSELSNSLLYPIEGVGNTATRTSTSPPHSALFRHSSPPLCKNHQKPKKIQTCETPLHWSRALYFPHTDVQNSQYIV